MRKKTLFAVMTVAACAIVAAGGLLASNMGFKLNYRLNANAGAGGVGTGKNTLSLPYFRQSGQNDSLQLMQDIGGGTIAAINSVGRFNEATDTFQTYTGRMASPIIAPFALAAGEGYLIAMASNVNYIVVGSHDPSLAIGLQSAGGGSNSGKNFFAPPYNITATNSLQLMQDIGGGSILPVNSIGRFNATNDTFQTYTGRMASPILTPFVLVPGEAYLVAMASTVPYTPSHY